MTYFLYSYCFNFFLFHFFPLFCCTFFVLLQLLLLLYTFWYKKIIHCISPIFWLTKQKSTLFYIFTLEPPNICFSLEFFLFIFFCFLYSFCFLSLFLWFLVSFLFDGELFCIVVFTLFFICLSGCCRFFVYVYILTHCCYCFTIVCTGYFSSLSKVHLHTKNIYH